MAAWHSVSVIMTMTWNPKPFVNLLPFSSAWILSSPLVVFLPFVIFFILQLVSGVLCCASPFTVRAETPSYVCSSSTAELNEFNNDSKQHNLPQRFFCNRIVRVIPWILSSLIYCMSRSTLPAVKIGELTKIRACSGVNASPSLQTSWSFSSVTTPSVTVEKCDHYCELKR